MLCVCVAHKQTNATDKLFCGTHAQAQRAPKVESGAACARTNYTRGPNAKASSFAPVPSALCRALCEVVWSCGGEWMRVERWAPPDRYSESLAAINRPIWAPTGRPTWPACTWARRGVASSRGEQAPDTLIHAAKRCRLRRRTNVRLALTNGFMFFGLALIRLAPIVFAASREPRTVSRSQGDGHHWLAININFAIRSERNSPQ